MTGTGSKLTFYPGDLTWPPCYLFGMMRVQEVVVFLIAAVVLVAAAELVFWALDRIVLGNG